MTRSHGSDDGYSGSSRYHFADLYMGDYFRHYSDNEQKTSSWEKSISHRTLSPSSRSKGHDGRNYCYEVLAYWCTSLCWWTHILSPSTTMVARSYILDTRAVQRNSPLVLSALLTAIVKKHLAGIGREDLA